MRIVLIALHFAEYSLSLAEALAKDNDVLLILIERNFNNEIGSVEFIPKEPRLRVLILPHQRSVTALIGNIFTIAKSIRRFEPDVIHCQEEPKDYLIGALPFLRGIPFVLTVHDPKPHTGLDAKRINYSRRAIYLKLLRRRADAVIVHGEHLKAIAETHMPEKKGRIFSVPHGPLGKIFRPPIHFDWEVGNCLFFGRIEAYKGLGYFVEAIQLLRDKGLPVTGVIAGRGSELARYNSVVRDNPAFRVIDRYLSQSEVIECFQQTNVVVMPYIEATQSGVSAYAIGLGRPVVATRVGGLPESVIDRETGLIVEPENVSALGEAIECLVKDQEKAKAMANRAMEWGEAQLSWERMSALSLKAYVFAVGDRV